MIWILLFSFPIFCRIQIGWIHFSYGLIITGRSLCVPHSQERQMGHFQ